MIRRITWKHCLGIHFLENLISVTWNNVFGINFAMISGWREIYFHYRYRLQARNVSNLQWFRLAVPRFCSGFAKRGACKRGLRKLVHRTYQVHSNYMPETWSDHDCHWQQCIYSASISRKKSTQPKCASCMNHIWAIALFGQARFTPARFADYQSAFQARLSAELPRGSSRA